jgi:glycosyltransferase involved in cell wall biosynthesis
MQQLPAGLPVEVIMVDNLSQDGSSEFVKNYVADSEKFHATRILTESQPGKPFALETGFDAASFECIVVCDDDNSLDPDFVAKAAELMGQLPDVAIIGSQSRGGFESEEPFWFQRYSKSFAVGKQASESGYVNAADAQLWGAGMVIRKSFWNSLRQKGFSFLIGKHKQKAVGEDTELCILSGILGYRMYYAQELCLTHFMTGSRLNWDAYLRLCEGFGSTAIFLDYYAEFLANGTLPAPVEFRKLFSQKMKKKLWELVIKTKGRVLLPALLTEGNKFRAEWVRYQSAYKVAVSDDDVPVQLAAIKSFLHSIVKPHVAATA